MPCTLIGPSPRVQNTDVDAAVCGQNSSAWTHHNTTHAHACVSTGAGLEVCETCQMPVSHMRKHIQKLQPNFARQRSALNHQAYPVQQSQG